MRSKLEFYDFDSNAVSDCGDVLEIEFSSEPLNWDGVVLEKGSSPHFYPNNVYTPYFYFALALDEDLHWRVATDGGMATLKTTPGEIWINPPSTPFSHDISEPCHFVILAVKEQIFLENCTLNLKGKDLQFLNNYNVQDDVIKGMLDLFLIEASTGGRNGYAYLKNLLSLLSTHYIHNYSNYDDLEQQRAAGSRFDQRQMARIDRYIEDHIGASISVDNLADMLGCSKFYFLREFKKLVGITPYQYLLNKRLELAQTRLAIPGSSIATVGMELGFNDQAHFTRAFKTQFGETPGQFQKKRRKTS